jgi:hypothetical protein
MLGKIHFYAGIGVVLIFLYTGYYMRHYFGELFETDMMNRALFRAGHLYILSVGLINAALGAHFQISNTRVVKTVQRIGSVVIFMATFLIIYGFFKEFPTEQIERPITQNALYLILLGVSIHGLIYLWKNNKAS